MNTRAPGSTTAGPIAAFLARDHVRLDALLRRTDAGAGEIDPVAFGEFRIGLLTHIRMEEKVLLPAAQRARGGTPLASAAKLRLDHGALAALLVPPPTRAIVAAIRTILTAHNPIEEGPGGVYEVSEQVMGAEAEPLLARLRSVPAVRVSPHVDSPRVRDAMRRALARAGFDPDAMGL